VDKAISEAEAADALEDRPQGRLGLGDGLVHLLIEGRLCGGTSGHVSRAVLEEDRVGRIGDVGPDDHGRGALVDRLRLRVDRAPVGPGLDGRLLLPGVLDRHGGDHRDGRELRAASRLLDRLEGVERLGHPDDFDTDAAHQTPASATGRTARTVRTEWALRESRFVLTTS
jgi:hypothetical protein